MGKQWKSMENWNNLTLSKTRGKLKETGKTIWKKSGQCGSLGGQKKNANWWIFPVKIGAWTTGTPCAPWITMVSPAWPSARNGGVASGLSQALSGHHCNSRVELSVEQFNCLCVFNYKFHYCLIMLIIVPLIIQLVKQLKTNLVIAKNRKEKLCLPSKTQ
jgi:hypothetical protein